MNEDLVQYFVVNSELEMSPGKVAAQVAHVATKITYELLHNDALEYTKYQNWFFDWFNGDQKKIILKGKEKDLLKLIDEGWNYIRDNGLTEIPPNSLTVVGCSPMPKSVVQKQVKRLRLY